MAGVPSIMQAMLDEVVTKLKSGVRMLSETVRADAREGDIGMQLGEIAKANPEVAIGSYPFFDPQHGPNTNVALRARDAQKLAQAKREIEEMLERVRRAQSNSLALSRRKQGFESPRERHVSFSRLNFHDFFS
jgi:molybdopterin-biosynthesis enzyme MoeA-like protein